MHISPVDYKILALESNVFVTKELVTSKNRMYEELFTLLKFVIVNLILQLKVLLLLSLWLFKFIDKIKECMFAIPLPRK